MESVIVGQNLSALNWVAREQFHVEFDEFDFLRGRLPRIFWRPDREAPLRPS